MQRQNIIDNLQSIDYQKLTKAQEEAVDHAVAIIKSIAPSDFERGEKAAANDECCGGGCHGRSMSGTV